MTVDDDTSTERLLLVQFSRYYLFNNDFKHSRNNIAAMLNQRKKNKLQYVTSSKVIDTYRLCVTMLHYVFLLDRQKSSALADVRCTWKTKSQVSGTQGCTVHANFFLPLCIGKQIKPYMLIANQKTGKCKKYQVNKC